MNIIKTSFGTIPAVLPEGMSNSYTGRQINNYALSNDNGMTIEISEYGAVITKMLIPDKNGVISDIQLGYDDLEGYIGNDECFGALVGRCANRTSDYSFTLNGVKYILENNDLGKNLHSGITNNYFRRPWDFVSQSITDDCVSVTLHLFSPDLDQGFPGNLDVFVTYSVKNDGSFIMNYRYKSDKDTVVNLTNHSYMNLGGHDSGLCLDQICWVDAQTVTENKKGNLPTGKIRDIKGSALDFSSPKALRKDFDSDDVMMVNAKGYDFNYILNNNGQMKFAATLKHPTNGRMLSVYTDLPGLQVYTGNYLDKAGKGGYVYHDYDGVCFESQQFPDAIHFDNFPSPVLKADTEFETTTIFKFGICE